MAKIRHIAYRAVDVDAMAKFFVEAMGMKLIQKRKNNAIDLSDGSVNITVLPLAAGMGGKAGIDHIGLGGDYDGMDSAPIGMEDVSGYPALFVELARRGYSQADLEKISSRNIIRALRQAEQTAASLKSVPPSEARIGN